MKPDKIDIIIRGVDRETWKKFREMCLKNDVSALDLATNHLGENNALPKCIFFLTNALGECTL